MKIHKTVKHYESHGLEATEVCYDETRDEEDNEETSYSTEVVEETTNETGGSYVEPTIDESRGDEDHEESSINITAPPEMEENDGLNFPCDMCDKRCASMVLLGLHKTLQHKETLQFKCNECELITNYPNNLERHMKTHQEKRKNTNIQSEQVKKKTKISEGFNCDQCKYVTKENFNLRRHTGRVHREFKWFKWSLNVCIKGEMFGLNKL